MWLIKLKMGLGKIKHLGGKWLNDDMDVWVWDGHISAYSRRQLMHTGSVKITVSEISPGKPEYVMRVQGADQIHAHIKGATKTSILEMRSKLLNDFSKSFKCRIYGRGNQPEFVDGVLTFKFSSCYSFNGQGKE